MFLAAAFQIENLKCNVPEPIESNRFLRGFVLNSHRHVTNHFLPPLFTLVLLFPSLQPFPMDSKPQQSLTPHKQSKTARPAARKLIRVGTVNVRERSTFSGSSWKPKELELDSEALTVISVTIDVHSLLNCPFSHQDTSVPQPFSNKRTRIALQDISELERTDLTDRSLGLTAKAKKFNLSFASDSELYDWRDDIYQRCPLGNYSDPFDFVHKSHIGSDSVFGIFVCTTQILHCHSHSCTFYRTRTFFISMLRLSVDRRSSLTPVPDLIRVFH